MLLIPGMLSMSGRERERKRGKRGEGSEKREGERKENDPMTLVTR
jgi:hypothetical protein